MNKKMQKACIKKKVFVGGMENEKVVYDSFSKNQMKNDSTQASVEEAERSPK
jgi:hypothetical protein